MNIKEAKEEIKRSVEVYLDKNEQGEYVIPYMNQRPVFIEGAPGIGKTAIVAQVAAELDVALVTCSMTHYTMRSALGRAYIKEKKFDGKRAPVAEYTVGEIVASVYQVMGESGKKEGILFLDEINCVSEALVSAMLLFLQYKKLGGRQIPEGWVIVTAGNPPQYNRAVRRFDIATLDRLKCLEVEADFEVWKEYAYYQGIHPAIIAFLEENRDCFFMIAPYSGGHHYATPRGWEDLSRAIQSYERKGFQIDRKLVQQYVADFEIAGKFVCYYDMFHTYKLEYPAAAIDEGQITDALIEQIKDADFHKRICWTGIMLEKVNQMLNAVVERENLLQRVMKVLREAKKEITCQDITMPVILESECIRLQIILKHRQAAHSISAPESREYQNTIVTFRQYLQALPADASGKEQFAFIRKKYNSQIKRHESQIRLCGWVLENVFTFVEKAWGTEQDMLYLMTTLTANAAVMSFIGKWGCEPYYRYGRGLPGMELQDAPGEEPESLKL